MGTNPYQGQSSDQSGQYGGYTGYTPPASGSQQGQDYQYGQSSSSDQSYQYGQYSPPASVSGQQQQQQSMYQPPLSAQKRPEPASIVQPERNAATMSYALGPLTGLVYFFILGRKSRFVRFAAAQSTIFFGLITIIYVILRLIAVIPVLGTVFLSPIIGFVTGVLLIPSALIWVFLMIMAYRGVKIHSPIFGDYAEGMIQRFTKNK